jgi:hypothetical protein
VRAVSARCSSASHVVTSGPGSAQQAVRDLGRLYQEQFDLEILYPVEQSVQVPLVPDVADK